MVSVVQILDLSNNQKPKYEYGQQWYNHEYDGKTESN